MLSAQPVIAPETELPIGLPEVAKSAVEIATWTVEIAIRIVHIAKWCVRLVAFARVLRSAIRELHTFLDEPGLLSIRRGEE